MDKISKQLKLIAREVNDIEKSASQQYVNKIKKLCQSFYKQDEQQQLENILVNINTTLEEIKNSTIDFTVQELQFIKDELKYAFESLEKKGILNKSDMSKIFSNLNIKIASVSNAVGVGLVTLLLTCSTLFADTVKKKVFNRNDPKINQLYQLNTSSATVVKQAVDMLIGLQGAVRGNVYDSKGNIVARNVHIVYDDCKGKRKAIPWDGKSSLEKFIANCTGKATIGYGLTSKRLVSRGYLTDEEAIGYMQRYVSNMVTHNKRLIGAGVLQSLTYKQQACLMALWYNLGDANKTPNCVKYLQYAYNPKLDPKYNPRRMNRSYYLRLAAKQFLDCNKSDGKQVQGLTNRVNYLHNVFLSDVK